MTKKTLFEPYSLGSLTLRNRIVMAPLTRNRANPGFIPGDLAAEYYSQRASAGLGGRWYLRASGSGPISRAACANGSPA
jgi:2,4-dienoyl-CoA reductase-like NADH-dependent reductase (Old Yellow Enzyme family)